MKKLIVIGTGWSGSGAVFEYLAGREQDIAAPFGEAEFRLIADPGGLFLLHSTLNNCFSVHNADNAIKEFLRLCTDLNRRLSFQQSYIPIKMAEHFIQDITAIRYKGAPIYEVQRLGRLKKFIYVLLRDYIHKMQGKTSQLFPMYYPVDTKNFVDRSIQFIDEIVKYNISDKKQYDFCVINHGGSFWNPVTSTQFYGQRNTLIVTRDPRDIFVEMKKRGNAYPSFDVEVFCNWYQDMFSRVNVNEHNDESVIMIRFEEFVHNFAEEKIRIDTRIGLNHDTASSYKPEESKKNIGKFRNELTKKEINTIENKLSKFIKSKE